MVYILLIVLTVFPNDLMAITNGKFKFNNMHY